MKIPEQYDAHTIAGAERSEQRGKKLHMETTQ
jgi:hypothetical protein